MRFQNALLSILGSIKVLGEEVSLLGGTSSSDSIHVQPGRAPSDAKSAFIVPGNPKVLPVLSRAPHVSSNTPSSIANQKASVDTTSTVKTEGTAICWNSIVCRFFFQDIEACYKESGPIKNPNDQGGQSTTYQRCLCEGGNDDYKNILVQNIKDAKEPVQSCLDCFAQAGMSASTGGQISNTRGKIYDFCNTAHPNVYDLLVRILNFMKAADQPLSFTEIPSEMSSITTLADRFTSTAGMNLPTTIAPGFTRIGSGKGGSSLWWESTLSAGMPIPTEYLQQLPPKWPYTKHGIARRAGSITSFPFVNPNATMQTVAWLYHSLLWNPRPLFTPAAFKNDNPSEVYQPLLDGWTHTFVNGQSTTTTLVGKASIPTTAPRTLPSRTTTTEDPATSLPLMSTTPKSHTFTTSISTSSIAQVTLTRSTFVESLKLASSFRPMRQQDPPLPLEPDSNDEPDNSPAPRISAEATNTQPAVQVMAALTSSVPPETALSDLWNEVQSMKSRLGP